MSLRRKACEGEESPEAPAWKSTISDWAVYYTYARCSFGWNFESLGRRGLPWAILGERFGVATEPRVVEPSCLAASGISEELSSCVLDTLSFVCSEMGSVCGMVPYVHIDPATCTVSDILCFLRYRIDSGSLPSALKVYVAAIVLFRSPLGGQLIGRDALVVSFLKGARRLHPAPAFSPALGPWSGIKNSFTAITRAFSIR